MNLISPALPLHTTTHLKWSGLHGCTHSLAIANAAKNHSGVTIVITPDIVSAEKLADELDFFSADLPNCPRLTLADWEILPYDYFSPHQDIISQRLLTLSKLPYLQQGILIVPITTALYRLAPRDYLTKYSFNVSVNDKINDLQKFCLDLQKNGYRRVEQVMEHGEFAIRGAIIDLFVMGSNLPYRIELFADEIATIRTFDLESQRSLAKVTAINLLPAKEFPLDHAAITLFREQWHQNFSGNPLYNPVYQAISKGQTIAGIENYLPLFFTSTANIYQYLPSNSLLLYLPDTKPAATKFWTEVLQRYEQLKHDQHRNILPPTKILFSPEEFFAAANHLPQIQIQHEASKFDFHTSSLPNLSVNHQQSQPLLQLTNYLQNHPAKVLFCTETLGRQEFIIKLLASAAINPTPIASWQAFLAAPNGYYISVAPINQGASWHQPDTLVITENELLGQITQQRRKRKTTTQDPNTVIRNLVELKIGDAVTHADHGVGRFLGLTTLTVDDHTDEYLLLSYANDDKLYVPISSLNLITRYSGSDPEHAPLYKLGGTQWAKAKEKAAKKIIDVATELLDIHALRAAKKGFTCQPIGQDYINFVANFPFEETPDQHEAIEKVIADMCADKPMDRLICGDVGFGKTEVAMRAAFIAAQNGRQTVVLTPTTLLAQQHYQNFCDRFAGFPINIEMISRFRSAKQQQKILTDLANGTIDIIIGTHKLLQPEIKFKNLGLLVIDEEHRFGVRQKERIKALRTEIDILTLTATPIPRTLNMAFAGIRDLSLIATPPQRRLAIKTFITEYHQPIIREAVLREILRGGQVYYLHNDVATIQKTADDLAQLIPEAKINFAHGQMHERQLERIMVDFYHRQFNLLVCTTIIESGIDIPSANTIIIERADKLGLAQLHQLRGRVGRSHHQAYAYLLTPPALTITKDAQKRLEAIGSLEDLGMGFTLATHDMEIRGAGEFLGEEQSGHIQEIGFDLYMEMLERAIQNIKAGKSPNLEQPLSHNTEIDLQITNLIPDDYIHDINTRLTLYKRIASATNNNELADLRVEMIDRFGLLPAATQNLFLLRELKLRAEQLGIIKIEGNQNNIRLTFNEQLKINPDKIIALVQSHPQKFRLDGANKLKYLVSTNSAAERIKAVEEVLAKL